VGVAATGAGASRIGAAGAAGISIGAAGGRLVEVASASFAAVTSPNACSDGRSFTRVFCETSVAVVCIGSEGCCGCSPCRVTMPATRRKPPTVESRPNRCRLICGLPARTLYLRAQAREAHLLMAFPNSYRGSPIRQVACLVVVRLKPVLSLVDPRQTVSSAGRKKAFGGCQNPKASTGVRETKPLSEILSTTAWRSEVI